LNIEHSLLPPSLFGGKVCVVGVGNRMKGDDAAGPLAVDAMSELDGIACIDAGVAPENHLEQIVARSPDTVLIIDAVDFNAEPGELRIFPPDGLSGGLSTHALSLSLVADYLEQRCGASTWLIGIQPAQVTLGSPVTPAVQQTITRLVAYLQATCLLILP